MISKQKMINTLNEIKEIASLELVLFAQLITISLADGTVLARPGVPDVGTELRDSVRLLLPDPEYLIDAVLDAGFAEGHYRELLAEIIAVGDAEFLNGVRGRAVLPAGADVEIGIIKAVFKNIAAIFNINSVCVAHPNSP